jgi:RNA polymerase sigma-70 factor, ECF subfamily
MNEELMHKVQQGDEDAYKELLDQIGFIVVRHIRRHIRNEETVNDLYQTVFMTLHRARHTYDTSKPFKPWLYAITKNVIYDYLRKNKKRIELEMLTGFELTVEAQKNTEQEEVSLLGRALKTLSPRYEEAIRLVKIDGLSMEEAAQKLGISKAAMKVRAHRGYEKLKKYLINEAKHGTT